MRTRTIALSTGLAVLVLLLALAVLSDFGLRTWLDDARWDRLALHLAPLVPVYGWPASRSNAPRARGSGGRSTPAPACCWSSCWTARADGRLFHYLGGIVAGAFQAGVGDSDATLLDTVAALSLNGILFYLVGSLADARGTGADEAGRVAPVHRAPFAILEPLAYLSRTAEYATRLRLDLPRPALVTMALLSHRRQRKSFYYAGLINTGVAFWLIADHYDWFDKPSWAILLVAVGARGPRGRARPGARERRAAGRSGCVR